MSKKKKSEHSPSLHVLNLNNNAGMMRIVISHTQSRIPPFKFFLHLFADLPCTSLYVEASMYSKKLYLYFLLRTPESCVSYIVDYEHFFIHI